jgi:hypothetical protein
MKLQVTKAHKASFDYSVLFKNGETVRVGRENPEMRGWFWCKNRNSVWSWIPEEYLNRQGAEGTITHDYDTTELTVKTGEMLEYATEVKFWTLCVALDGKKGWVPTGNLKRN